MAQINLLPWRETLRKEKQKEYIAITAFFAALTAVVIGFVHIHMNGAIEYQKRRNQYLENEIKILDGKIKEIEKLESTKKALIDRMNVIQNLQATRPQVVHLFDELVRTLPNGVYLTGVKQSQGKLDISGKAESNARVSAYMRNIDASQWLAASRLNVIETQKTGFGRVSDFKLEAQQTAPKSTDE